MRDMNIYLIKMTAGWNDKYSHKNMKLCNQLTYVFKREKTEGRDIAWQWQIKAIAKPRGNHIEATEDREQGS